MNPTLVLKIRASKDGKKITMRGAFKGVDNSLEFAEQPEGVKTLAAVNAAILALTKRLNDGGGGNE